MSFRHLVNLIKSWNMFLVLLKITFFNSCFIPAAICVAEKSGSENFKNGSFAFRGLTLSPFDTVLPIIPTLQLPPVDYSHILVAPPKKHVTRKENDTRKDLLAKLLKSAQTTPTKPSAYPEHFKTQTSSKHDKQKELITAILKLQNRGPARMPELSVPTKDFGTASHYRMKGVGKESSSKRNHYLSILDRLLKPRRSRKKHSIIRQGSPSSHPYPMTSTALSAPGWGWGKGGSGFSAVDALLCALTLLSLGGFLLNLLLNLMNLFGFGFQTSTSTYPVTTTQTTTQPTGMPTGTPPGTTTGTLPTLTGLAIASGGSGFSGFTGRTIDSVGNGWGQNNTNGWGWGETSGWGWKPSEARIKINVRLPAGGWSSNETTTTTPPPTATYPTADGLVSLLPGRHRRRRPKRETFQPYVNPTTMMEVFAKNVLNSINAATNRYECIENVFCESNKQARVIGQWMDYFMPLYSFSVSYFGHKAGAHDSLLDHLSAIVLGAAETVNCQTYFPRCGAAKKS